MQLTFAYMLRRVPSHVYHDWHPHAEPRKKKLVKKGSKKGFGDMHDGGKSAADRVSCYLKPWTETLPKPSILDPRRLRASGLQVGRAREAGGGPGMGNPGGRIGKTDEG
eukprot:2279139-Rhodomonas_salina.1